MRVLCLREKTHIHFFQYFPHVVWVSFLSLYVCKRFDGRLIPTDVELQRPPRRAGLTDPHTQHLDSSTVGYIPANKHLLSRCHSHVHCTSTVLSSKCEHRVFGWLDVFRKMQILTFQQKSWTESGWNRLVWKKEQTISPLVDSSSIGCLKSVISLKVQRKSTTLSFSFRMGATCM